MIEDFKFSTFFEQKVLPFIADSIQAAHLAKPDGWGLTPLKRQGLIRLNVGMPEVLNTNGHTIVLVVDGELASQTTVVQSGEVTLEPSTLSSVPGSQSATLEINDRTEELLIQLKDAHRKFIQQAARTPRNPSIKIGHRDQLVKDISEKLGIDLHAPQLVAESTWTRDELKASVEAYLDLKGKMHAGEEVNKKQCYRDLSKRYGRTEKAYEYRMQNISYVLSLAGREWIAGLPPASNVGVNVAAQIEDILAEAENRPTEPSVGFEAQVRANRRKTNLPRPLGVKAPKLIVGQATQYIRDPDVKAWVIQECKGECECCSKPAPFLTGEGFPFLEVHHVLQLADEGPDTVENAVALCPNCHREIHHGIDGNKLIERLYSTIARLIRKSSH